MTIRTLCWSLLALLLMLSLQTGTGMPSHAQAPTGCPVDLMLVLDGSGSISAADFEIMKAFTAELVSGFSLGPEDAQIGVVQFGTQATLESPLTGDQAALNAAISRMGQLSSDTNIVAGMQEAQAQLANARPSDVPKVMIVLTDGAHTEAGDPVQVANAARADGVFVFGIAVGDADLDQISAIAGGDQNVILVEAFGGLAITLDVLINSACAVALPPRDTQIVFASDRDGDMEIFTMDADGSNVRQLTFNDADDDKPSWSKDGRYIAWESNLDGDYEIFTMNADGSNQTQLTENNVDDWGPAWSPDGNLIAYHSELDGDVELHVMDTRGGNIRQVTFNNGAVDRSASWSPDGLNIVYYSDASGGRELYVVNVNTLQTRRLSSNSFYDGLPDWSLNGTQIVFGSTREDGDVEIYTMRVDGRNVQRVTRSPGVDDDPVWSPDGSQIVFESARNGNLDIWVMNADGTDARPLTSEPSQDWSADWIWKP